MDIVENRDISSGLPYQVIENVGPCMEEEQKTQLIISKLSNFNFVGIP